MSLTYHNRRSLCSKVVQQFLPLAAQLLPRTHEHYPVGNAQKRLQNESDFRRPDPLPRVDKARGLVPYVYEALLYVLERRHFSVRVTLQIEPGGEGLERAVGAAPAVIVHFVLAIVVVVVFTSYRCHFTACNS